MKNGLNLLPQLHALTRKFCFLTTLLVVFSCFCFTPVRSQQSLCQQMGGSFVPDIIIGTDENSITNATGAGWTNKKVEINGTLVVNANFLISSCKLKMGRNATIRIDPNITFQSLSSNYFRCGNDLWKGFVVMGGSANFWFNQIEDASVALNIKSASASLIVFGNTINRNNKGILAQGVSVNAFVASNLFDCTSALNGQSSPLGFAGIQLSNCPSASFGVTNIAHTFRNVFKRQSFGITMDNTTATIGFSTFSQNTTGIFLSKSNAIIRGVDADNPTNFSLNGKDINSNSSGLEVFNCYMDSCKSNNITAVQNNNLEQIHIHDNTIHVTDEPSAINPKIGISLDRSKFGDDDLFRNTIERNHIIMHDFSAHSRRAMHIRGGASIHDFMRIDSNTIEAMTGGNSAILTKFVDIDISGADNFHITRNTISSSNTFSTGNNRWGFFLVNGAMTPAEGNIFWTNNILGIGPDDGCCAVHAEDAGPWSFCSNTTDQTYRGFHFIGNCGKSNFGINTMHNHNFDPLNLYVGGTGLFLQGHGADNAFLGKQICQANTWEVTDYALSNAYTAILIGNNLNGPNNSTISNNEFQVADINDPHQAPIDRNPMQNWFKFGTDCLQTPTGCVEPDVDNFDEHDGWVRDHYPYPQASPGVEEWQSTRYVLAKLMRYPNLATGSTLAFRNAYSQSSATRFARFDSLMNAISSATSYTQTGLNSLEADIQSKQAQINALDASIVDYTNIPAGLLSSRAVLLNQMAVLSNQRNAILAQISAVRMPLLSLCEQFNNALPSTQVYEQNQKVLNALAIQQARGIELTQSDKQALHAIAQQCTQVAGRTQAAAAAMLPQEEGQQYWRENPDDNNCLQRTSRDAGLQEIGYALAPNPCSDILHIQFEIPFTGEVIISDLSGRVVQQWPVPEKAQILDIPVQYLNNGVYILSCTNLTNKLPATTKFVVLR